MKEKFIKSTIVLIIGGFLTKILAMLIRIVTTRIIGVYGIGLFMLIMPTYSLFITLSTLSLPVAISKLVSENNRNNKKIVLGIIPIAILFNIFIVAIFILFSKFIAVNLLKNSILYYPLIASAITLPFVTLSSIIRGYFFGKQKMIPHVVSNLIEQIIRILMTIFLTPFLLKYGIVFTITCLVLFNIVSEVLSTIVLLCFIPRGVKIKKSDIVFDTDNIKDILKISMPTTAGRIINSIGNFLEPIIITFVLMAIGYNNRYITMEYGIITGFVFPMVMMPQFLSGAVSSALLPTISNYYALGNKLAIKRKFYQAVCFSFVIGIIFTIIFMIFPDTSLNLMFNNTDGSSYLVFAAPIFLITYISGPIVSTLQAIDKAKVVMNSSLIGVIIKTVLLFSLLYLDINMYALLVAIFIQYLIVTIYQYLKLKKYLVIN